MLIQCSHHCQFSRLEECFSEVTNSARPAEISEPSDPKFDNMSAVEPTDKRPLDFTYKQPTDETEVLHMSLSRLPPPIVTIDVK